MRTKDLKKRARITALLATGASVRDIAQTAGCSLSMVAKVKGEISLNDEEQRELLNSYRRTLLDKIPPEQRAERYAQLINQDSQLMVSLKALERIDHIQFGQLTKEEPPKTEERQPMFHLPPGSAVKITVDAPAINITPDQDQ